MVEEREIFLGRFVKPVGIKGEIKLVPSNDFWEGVLESKELILRVFGRNGGDVQPFELERFRRQKTFYVLKVVGIGDRNAAEELVGAELFVSTKNLDVELPDKPLPFQVVGNTVVAEDGRHLGEVTSVLFTPVHDVYEVAGEEGTFLVPAVPEFILSTDVKKRQIVIRPIPGLLND